MCSFQCLLNHILRRPLWYRFEDALCAVFKNTLQLRHTVNYFKAYQASILKVFFFKFHYFATAQIASAVHFATLGVWSMKRYNRVYGFKTWILHWLEALYTGWPEYTTGGFRVFLCERQGLDTMSQSKGKCSTCAYIISRRCAKPWLKWNPFVRRLR